MTIASTASNTRIDDLVARFDGRFDDVNARISELRADLARIDDWLGAVEIAVGKVDQCLLTIDASCCPAPGLTHARRISATCPNSAPRPTPPSAPALLGSELASTRFSSPGGGKHLAHEYRSNGRL